jgi:tRNA (guanine-N7-)-methyltransferase
LDWVARFGRSAPLGLEIGFGSGQALLDWGETAPEFNLIGVEVYQPGIGSLLQGRAERGLEHIQVVEGDVTTVLTELFPLEGLAEVRIFFPDPWPKRRHLKRRLIQPSFISELAIRLVPGGRLRLATDWQPYASWMLRVLDAEKGLKNEAEGFAERFEGRPVTRFEARGQRLGHEVWDLCFRRVRD